MERSNVNDDDGRPGAQQFWFGIIGAGDDHSARVVNAKMRDLRSKASRFEVTTERQGAALYATVEYRLKEDAAEAAS